MKLVQDAPAPSIDLNAPHIQAMVADMARRGEARLNDPNYEWIEWDDALAELAAPHIAAARKLRRMTQSELGEKLGIPQSQVSRMEKDPESVTYRTLKRVARALGMRVTDLLSPDLITQRKK